MIKNTRADVTYALKQVKCQRRIALTGSPLQNNLMEYYCVRTFSTMCSFHNLVGWKNCYFLYGYTITYGTLCGTDGGFCKGRVSWEQSRI